MNRRSSLVTMAELLFGSGGLHRPADSLPVRRVIFEGAYQDEAGLTLRFGNGINFNEMQLIGFQASLNGVKNLCDLTGTDAGTDEIMAALNA